MKVNFLDLQAQYPLIREEVEKKFQNIIGNSAFVSGKYVEEFEETFAQYCGVKHCIAVNSGTAALELALMATNVGAGGEVIVPVNTFIATAEAVSLRGATPVFIDVDPHTYLIDTAKIEEVVTEKTRAIIPVHLYGQVADMDAVNKIAQKHNLVVIEDACQAHGSEYKGRRAGSFGAVAAFSFYPGKNLGAWGEGGAITTDSDELARTLRLLRDHGSPIKYVHEIIGGNYRMDEFQGAVLGTKLQHLDMWNAKRQNWAALYLNKLSDISAVVLPEVTKHTTPVWHLFVIQVNKRDSLREYFASQGVQTGIHYPTPLHKTRAYSAPQFSDGSFPNAETVSARILSLPMYPELIDEEVRFVTDTVKQFLS